jgi:hypothetical protein
MGMLDSHLFTLLIIGIGLGALLASSNLIYHENIADLKAELEVLLEEPVEANTEAREALAKQKAEIGQKLESLTLRFRNSIISDFLLLLFIILLALRIFLWSWHTQPDVMQSMAPGRFLRFDKILVSVLVLLLLHLCVSHLLLDLPPILSSY